MPKANNNKDQKIYPIHNADLTPKNLFKSFRHAKKILAKVALDFFDNKKPSSNSDIKKFESFMKGTLKPKFVTSLEDVGYFPNVLDGYYTISVLIDKHDSDEVKFDKWTRVLAVICPASGDLFMRNIMRIYLDFYNDKERDDLDKQAEAEFQNKNEGVK